MAAASSSLMAMVAAPSVGVSNVSTRQNRVHCGRVGAARFPRFTIRAADAVAAPSAGPAEKPAPAPPSGGSTTAPSKQKIRIKLRSYWVPLIEQACQQILEAAKNTSALTMGPVPLPTKRRIYCVLRSPHVDKDSREHFEIRTHRRLIDLANPNARTIDALMQLDLPAGVDVEVKLS